MHYSGILVTTSPQNFSECLLLLKHMEGVEVYHQEPDRGRAVVVQEAKTPEAHEAGFKRIAALGHVLGVELVYSYNDNNESHPTATPGKTQGPQSSQKADSPS